MKASGGYRLSGRLICNLPLIGLLATALLPAYVIGGAYDRLTGGGVAIFIGARKGHG
jgi:hypothetical protein